MYKLYILIFFILLSSFSLANDNFLSQEEKIYLKNKHEILMCVDPHWLPFEAIVDNKHIGIVADIIKIFGKDINTKIRLKKTDTWKQSLEFVKNRKCDILAASVETTQRKAYLNFTKPYLIFPQVIVTREKENFIVDFKDVIDEKIGITEGSAVGDLLRDKYPNINLVGTKNMVEGLYDVSSGKLFGFINTSASASYAVGKNGMTDLKVASKVGIDYALSIGIRNDDLILLDIFNKAINNIQKNKIDDIKKSWLKIKYEESIDYTIVYKIVGLFIIILSIILYWNRKLKNEIVKRRRLEEELNKLSQVVEQSRVSIIITDIKGTVEYINPYCEIETGYSKEEFIGKNPNILKSGYQDEKFYKNLWDTILDGKTWQGEFSNKNKNGDIFWESAIIAPIYDDKNIKYFASIKENITEKVIDRDKLQIAQEEAQNANNAKSEFLAKMSHEIRTPMNAVLGMLYLLEQTETTSIQKNYIKKSNHAANSLLDLINDILDFSKIEAGKLDIHPEEFEFNEMIMDILSVMSFKAEEKNLELLALYDDSIPTYIISDRLRISQILTNLLSNAIKFTNTGDILLSTKLIKKQNNSLEIMFCVKDSGVGISKSNQEMLFNEFSQVDSSATRSFEGTGLGLAISKKLSQLLDGNIWIDYSKENRGSIFCFTIKCEESKKIKNNIYKDLKLDNLKCLVVDDNSTAAEVLSKMLKSFGYDVLSVTSGKDAIAIIKNQKFDYIFLDYKMDELNGIETFKIIEEDLKSNNTKTIMVSAYSQEIVNEDIENINIAGYLSKPISPSILYNKIVELQNNILVKKDDNSEENNVKYFENAKILLVEDNKLNQEFTTSMLTNRGFKVDIATDGIESLSKIKNNDYDLVLMDIQMPHMDGLEATKHIRLMNGEYYKNIPIIALSANALLGDKEKSINAGMNQHITKPINPEELFDVLSVYIKSKNKIIKTPNVVKTIDKSLSDLDEKIFDIENTISKLNNNSEVYIKILKQFQDNYEEFYSEIETLINKNDIENLKKRVHELKGVSGNIGAVKLFDKLYILDRVLKKDELPTFGLLKDFNNELKNVLKEISKLETAKIISIKYDNKKVLKLLNKILLNLEEDIVLSEESFIEVKPYLQNEYKEFEISLSKALDDFDTDEAKIVIEKFINENFTNG